MSVGELLISIAVMAGITYIIRMLPMVVFRKRIESRFVQSFLGYIPYSVLAAMTFPSVLFCTGTMASAVAGTATAVILACRRKGLLTVALGAAAVVFVVQMAENLL